MRAGGHRSHRIASDPSHRAVRWQALLVLPCTRLRPYVDLLDAVERSAMERRDWWLGAAPAIEGFHVHDAIEARTASDDAPVPAPAPVCEEQRAAPPLPSAPPTAGPVGAAAAAAVQEESTAATLRREDFISALAATRVAVGEAASRGESLARLVKVRARRCRRTGARGLGVSAHARTAAARGAQLEESCRRYGDAMLELCVDGRRFVREGSSMVLCKDGASLHVAAVRACCRAVQQLSMFCSSQCCRCCAGATRATVILFSDLFLVAVKSPSIRGRMNVQACVPLGGASAADTCGGGSAGDAAAVAGQASVPNGYCVTGGRESVCIVTGSQRGRACAPPPPRLVSGNSLLRACRLCRGDCELARRHPRMHCSVRRLE